MTPFERVQSIVVGYFNVAGSVVTEDTRFEALDGDDLDRIDIVMSIEDAFKVRLSDDQMHEWQTIGELVALVEAAKPPFAPSLIHAAE